MNIPEAIKQLEDLYSVFCEVDTVEIIVADTKALEVAIEVLKEKSVKNQVELNKEIRRQRIISYRKQRTAQEVPVLEQLDKKDLHCIARHIQIDSFQKVMNEEKGLGNVCNYCNYVHECSKNGFSEYGTFKKLSSITGVSLSYVERFKFN